MKFSIRVQWIATIAAVTLGIVANLAKNCYERGRHLNGLVLPDIGFDLFAERPELRKIVDSLVVAYGIGSLSAWMAFGNDKSALLGLQMYAIVLFFNFIYSIVTTLPDSKGGDCDTKPSMLGICNDLGFSGHMATFLIVSYVNSRLQNHRYAWVHALVACALAWAIVSARNHYTIDVLNSFVVYALIASNVRAIPAEVYLR